VSSIQKPFSRADVLTSIERDLVWDSAAEGRHGRNRSWTELQGGAVALGQTLGLDETATGHLRRAALAHDIGKKAVPEAVLAKSGPLSDEEIAMIQSHVTVGYEVLSASPFLQPAAEIVLASQERFDGTGYPAGLRGPAIPLGARILAVADAFDALASARVHRDPLSRDDANVELVRGAGSHFDPEIVRAWLMTAERTTC
jgi:HD-GYP domain-containing protein (c-di-GMP phosphodiesterase class II)